ncbi:hypothetical protein KAJ61_03385 [Candidatus Parcubacteria bacterium]|nr:hypothetical protein [Candidatus Parcubacteria bacterium]
MKNINKKLEKELNAIRHKWEEYYSALAGIFQLLLFSATIIIVIFFPNSFANFMSTITCKKIITVSCFLWFPFCIKFYMKNIEKQETHNLLKNSQLKKSEGGKK